MLLLLLLLFLDLNTSLLQFKRLSRPEVITRKLHIALNDLTGIKELVKLRVKM